jgi:hypothetical protein
VNLIEPMAAAAAPFQANGRLRFAFSASRAGCGSIAISAACANITPSIKAGFVDFEMIDRPRSPATAANLFASGTPRNEADICWSDILRFSHGRRIVMQRLGRKSGAGRLLDGVEHNGFPTSGDDHGV